MFFKFVCALCNPSMYVLSLCILGVFMSALYACMYEVRDDAPPLWLCRFDALFVYTWYMCLIVNLVHWCMYVLDICMSLMHAWRFYSCACITGGVSTQKSVASASPKTKSNAQGEHRMPNCWFLRCDSRRRISCVNVTAACQPWCAGNKQAWKTKCMWSARCGGCSECLGG